MTRSKSLAIIVLAGAVGLAVAKLFGQSFGNFRTDQPFLARNYPTSIQPDLSGVAYHWVASDLSDGSVNTWTDRIQGAVFKQAYNSDYPTTIPVLKTTNGVVLGTQHYLTNQLLNWTTNMAYGFIGYCDDASDGGKVHPGLWSSSGGGLCTIDYSGIQFGGSVPGNNWGVGIGAGCGSDLTGDQIWMSNKFFTLVLSQQYQASNAPVNAFTVFCYTNGVYSDAEGLNDFENIKLSYADGPIYLGNDKARETGPRIYIKELWIWTNNAASSNGPNITPGVVANFNSWATSYYSTATVTNEWPYLLSAEWKASVGVTNTAGNTPVSGDKIKAWADSRHYNFLMQQLGTDDFRPYYVSSGGPNNAAYISFPVTNSLAAGLTNSYAQPRRLGQTNIHMWVVRFNPGTVEGVPWGTYSPTTGTIWDDWSIKNNRQLTINAGSAGPLLTGSDGGITTNVWYLVTVGFAGNNSFIRTNGVTYVTGATGQSPHGEYKVLGNCALCNNQAVIDVAHIQIYNLVSPWSSNDMRNAEVVLGAQYGITVP